MTLLSGEGHGKSGAIAGNAAEADLTTHKIQVSFDDAQTEAGTGDAGGVGGAEEAFK